MGTLGSQCGHLPSLDQAATRPTSANRSSERAAVFIIARESGQHRKAERWWGAERGGEKKSWIMLCRGPSEGIEDQLVVSVEVSKMVDRGGSTTVQLRKYGVH